MRTQVEIRKELAEQLRQAQTEDERRIINKKLIALARGESIQDTPKPQSGKEAALTVFPLTEQLEWIKRNTIYTDDVKDGMTTNMMYSYLYDATQTHNPGEDFKAEMIQRLKAAGYSVEAW